MPVRVVKQKWVQHWSSKLLTIQPPCKNLAILLERQPVKSVIMKSVGYDENTKILEIEFHKGEVYQYSGVPSKVYADLMHSSEIGKFFSEKIRPRFRAKPVVV
ncbi:KTSC domain-containing protein [Methanosphaerula palustris]|uniref:KTSC domain-containing protein n=1 Tax=Methanosphaerula palustris (strain ATCC BAA-1556 / DSM 19958 / E1-9c) TaxID=521011 RepID=B8GJB9_METPE|nr:KTSC domain-containing protein [Methanosphaerula palustris]ACL16960.1 hypothetical protein Mpal_1648 [Methanosphaerula palustris E1-9c]